MWYISIDLDDNPNYEKDCLEEDLVGFRGYPTMILK